jgi:NitT/TauT family transport system permease protein
MLWEAIVRSEGIPPYILPGPLLIAETLWTDGPSLLGSLLITLRITLAALAAAAILGGSIAILFSLSRVLALSLFPYAVILQVTPIVAIAPLIIIWVRQPFRSSPTRPWGSTVPIAIYWRCSASTAHRKARPCAT